MSDNLSFIEKQFPVSKLSKESYKERRAGATQTLTKFGKWWGRKPLILVRAVLLGCLLPSSDNPKEDMDTFLSVLSMDEEGLLERKCKRIPVAELYKIASSNSQYKNHIKDWFENNNGRVKFVRELIKSI